MEAVEGCLRRLKSGTEELGGNRDGARSSDELPSKVRSTDDQHCLWTKINVRKRRGFMSTAGTGVCAPGPSCQCGHTCRGLSDAEPHLAQRLCVWNNNRWKNTRWMFNQWQCKCSPQMIQGWERMSYKGQHDLVPCNRKILVRDVQMRTNNLHLDLLK